MVSEWPQSESSLTQLDDVCPLLLFSAIAAVAQSQALFRFEASAKAGWGGYRLQLGWLSVGWQCVLEWWVSGSD